MTNKMREAAEGLLFGLAAIAIAASCLWVIWDYGVRPVMEFLT